MNREQIRKRAEGLVKSLSDKQIADALVELLSRPRTKDTNSVRIWLIDEVESRFPDFEKAMIEAFQIDETANYDERLLAFVKEKVG